MGRLSRPRFIGDASPAPPTWIRSRLPPEGPSGLRGRLSSAKGKTVTSVNDISSACLPVAEGSGGLATDEGDAEFTRRCVDPAGEGPKSKVPTVYHIPVKDGMDRTRSPSGHGIGKCFYS